ncbi:MAG: diacylglycerol/lipid kinase family protein [Myxococcota bacterium]
MKTFLVVNPQSANGQTGRRWPEISAQLVRSLGELGHAFTEKPMDAARLAARALEEGYDCVVAVGGDGTLNEVVNGFFRDGKVINPSAALGLLPRGTGGDFRRTFSWDDKVPTSAARFATDKTAPFDVGVVDFTGHDGRPCSRYFANIASFGVSGQVDREVSKSKGWGGRLSFFLASTRALMKYSDRRVRLVADGGAPEELKVTTVAVANGRYFGGGMKVAPQADTADGLFDVTIWSGYGLADFAFKSKAIYDGSHVRLPGTRTFRCKTLRAESEEEVLLDVDGEQPGRLPCTMRILPSAIRLKV